MRLAALSNKHYHCGDRCRVNSCKSYNVHRPSGTVFQLAKLLRGWAECHGGLRALGLHCNKVQRKSTWLTIYARQSALPPQTPNGTLSYNPPKDFAHAYPFSFIHADAKSLQTN